MRIHIVGTCGPIAQLLHPSWIERSDIVNMVRILQVLDERLSLSTSAVKLVVSGGGFIEINNAQMHNGTTWGSEKSIDELMSLVQVRMQSVANALKDSNRDFVIGVDVLDSRHVGVGQFAVLLSAGEIRTVAWKSYPAGEETRSLAGFGTAKGRNSPRIALTVLGKVILLVCHDAQAYNHRHHALAARAFSPTPRQQVMNTMIQTIKAEKPEWALNLIHKIDKEESVKTFRNSYTQIHRDYGTPGVVGAFGYGTNVQETVRQLANRAQYPDGKASVVAILEVSRQGVQNSSCARGLNSS